MVGGGRINPQILSRQQRADRRNQIRDRLDEQGRLDRACARLIDEVGQEIHYPLKEKLMDPEQLLAKLEIYTKRFREDKFFEPEHVQKKKHDEDSEYLQVKDMTTKEVIREIEKYERELEMNRCIQVRPKRASLSDGSRHKRWVLKKRKLIIRKPESQKYMATRCLLNYILKFCREDISADMRMMYYNRRDLFKSVDSVSQIIDDICIMIGCTRASLHVKASEKGLVIGDISFTAGGITRNGNDAGRNGISIPSMNGDVSIMDKTDALFMLIVEKHTVWSRLAEDDFHKKFRCIMITARGMPDVDSRRFGNRVSHKFQFNAYALVDFNPYGMKIASVFRFGSKNMSYDSENLTMPYVELLGIKNQHLKNYELADNVILKMSRQDKIIAERLLHQDHLDELDDELLFMLATGKKLELEAFCSFGFKYFSCYLQLELQTLVD